MDGGDKGYMVTHDPIKVSELILFHDMNPS